MLRARLVPYADEQTILSCGADPASLPYMVPKLTHKNLLLEGVRPFAANILKQNMLSLGGDVAVHRNVISGKVDSSNCLLMGDLRHYKRLVEKIKSQPGLEAIAEVIEEQIFHEIKGLALTLCSNNYSWDSIPISMGILNITPDSFSDGGLWYDPYRALDHALEMVEQGADILDVGGESSRPGAESIDAREETARVVPIIEKIASRVNIPISIDTRNAETAEAALGAGACMINDVSALSHDPHMLGIAKEAGAGIILMHMRGTPGTMQNNTGYLDIFHEIYSFLDDKIKQCLEAGIDRKSILVDPGIGFGKDLKGNLSLIRRISEFRSLRVPVVLGHSRKSFIGSVLDASVDQRQEGTDAVSSWAIIQGVDVLRVHDIQRTGRIKKMILAVKDLV